LTKPRVGLAISAFRSDAAIEALLRSAKAMPAGLFESIWVVDSLGSGVIPQLIAREGWGDVQYVNSPTNLGSAGNLAERLRLGSEAALDFVYTVNHDGELVAEAVEALITFARARPNLGAAYPLRRHANRNGLFDLTGTSRFPRPFLGSKTRPQEPAVKTFWASSNGALYACAPLRAGLTPFADFWMGWEDLAYGWCLDDAGYEQWIVTAAEFVDNYEATTTGVGPFVVSLSDKPTWYSYYVARNLMLTASRTRRSPAVRGALVARIAAECLAASTVRGRRSVRLGLLLRGIFDGARGTAGKGPVP
jgi:GT2 family glycosyltransferase